MQLVGSLTASVMGYVLPTLCFFYLFPYRTFVNTQAHTSHTPHPDDGYRSMTGYHADYVDSINYTNGSTNCGAIINKEGDTGVLCNRIDAKAIAGAIAGDGALLLPTLSNARYVTAVFTLFFGMFTCVFGTVGVLLSKSS